jgi:hypothetical protein
MGSRRRTLAKYKFVAYFPVHDYVASLKEVAGKAADRRNKE